jgi:hypothetical protein
VARAVLDESGRVKHGAVAAGNKLGRQVRAVVHGEQVPSVGDEVLARRRDQGEGGCVEPIIVATSTVGDVPRGSWVVSDLLGRAVVDSRLPVVEVNVAGQDKVNPVLQKERLEGSLAVSAARCADVPRAMATGNDPRGLLAVDRGEVPLQPLELRTIRREWTSILGARAARKIGSIWEVGFRIELDKMDHSVVPRVPEIPYPSGLSRRHAFRL